jgi:hypothetical protein
MHTIRKGDRVRIKPEWQDDGDDEIVWIAIEDEDRGHVRIQPQLDMPIRPNQVVTTGMLDRTQTSRMPPSGDDGRRNKGEL